MADADPLEQLIVETRAFVDARPAPDFVNAVMAEVEHLETDRASAPRNWIVCSPSHCANFGTDASEMREPLR